MKYSKEVTAQVVARYIDDCLNYSELSGPEDLRFVAEMFIANGVLLLESNFGSMEALTSVSNFHEEVIERMSEEVPKP